MLLYYIEVNVSLSLRCFLQSRQTLRMLHYKQPSPMQRWKGSSMCWIRGSLYRVSANKLSRTVASSMSINRTGIAVMSYNSDNVHHLVFHYNFLIWAFIFKESSLKLYKSYLTGLNFNWISTTTD